MKLLGRVLFFKTGLRDHVRDDIDRHDQRARKTIDKLEKQLRDLRAASEAVDERLRQLGRRYDDLVEKHAATTELLSRQRERVGELKDHVSVLEKDHLGDRVAVLERARQDDHLARLRDLTSDLEARFSLSSLTTHVQQAIARSPLVNHPYPPVGLAEVVPPALHDLLFESRPPRGYWRGGQEGRENWTVGEDVAPLATEAPWRFMDDVVVPRVLMPALTRLFTDYLRTQDARIDAFERHGGRLMLRRPGYHFEPHLDPKRALLTGLFYFGRAGESHEFGTKIFRTNATVPDSFRGVYYPLQQGATCELVKTVPSRPNSMLVFASRVGLHGADIPADAQPPTLERYAYQFYIGKASPRAV